MNNSSTEDARRTIESVARASYGRLIAFLCARTRDVAGAEDALSEALVAALATWPRDGIPKNPTAWLLTVARHRLIDSARHERVRIDNLPTLEMIASDSYGTAEFDAIPDERLKLLFVCAHPAIDPDMHTPLMLQTVLGLSAVEIARAFLVSPAAMGQRLLRAKTKIRHAGMVFEVPEASELPHRLEAVLQAIYAAFGSGWEHSAGADQRARGLAEEAVWLARVLKERMPDEPEARGLLALTLHCEARRLARRTADGRFIPLSDQDPKLWIASMIDEAERELAVAATFSRLGRFQLEAAIQSVHADRLRTGFTDWNAITLFYEQLVRISPTLGALVGRAAAVAEVKGADAALSLLADIASTSVISYQPYWAVRAHLLKQSQRTREAYDAFDRAIGLTEDEATRRFLLERRAELERLA